MSTERSGRPCTLGMVQTAQVLQADTQIQHARLLQSGPLWRERTWLPVRFWKAHLETAYSHLFPGEGDDVKALTKDLLSQALSKANGPLRTSFSPISPSSAVYQVGRQSYCFIQMLEHPWRASCGLGRVTKCICSAQPSLISQRWWLHHVLSRRLECTVGRKKYCHAPSDAVWCVLWHVRQRMKLVLSLASQLVVLCWCAPGQACPSWVNILSTARESNRNCTGGDWRSGGSGGRWRRRWRWRSACSCCRRRC